MAVPAFRTSRLRIVEHLTPEEEFRAAYAEHVATVDAERAARRKLNEAAQAVARKHGQPFMRPEEALRVSAQGGGR